MSNGRSMPFSNGTEYEIFLDNFCNRCTNYKLREDGFAEFPEKGGCVILDAMENARFDVRQFPIEWIRELHDATDNHVIAWHYCIRFSNPDWGIMERYFTMMKNALIKREDAEHGTVRND